MKDSKLFSVNLKDILNGLLMAVLTPAVYIIQTSLEAGSLTLNWHQIGLAAVAGGFAYLVKNFFTAPDLRANDKV